MRDAHSHCEALVRRADRDRFIASLFAPAAARRHLFALYAFNIEVARTREVVRDPMAGAIRLQWWHDALAGAGREAAGHPVASALFETIARHHLPAQPLIELVEARRCDFDDEPMATWSDLESYARRTAGNLFASAARILAPDEPDVAEAARAAGIAYALTRLLAVFELHAARRQSYLPRELLQHHGVERHAVFAGQRSPPLARALAEARGRARAHYADFFGCAGSLPQAVVPVFLPLALVPGLLARLDRHAGPSVVEMSPWRRQWMLMRAARRGFPPP